MAEVQLEEDGVEHYEPRFWGLDPVFSARVKLNIIDVKSLQSHPIISAEVFCISNHPVQSVHVMGDVVSIQRKSRMIKYEVDDGTGVLSCTQWRLTEDSDQGLFIPKLGQLVSIWGKISEYKNEKQLSVSTIAEQQDPNAEPLHWLEIAYLKKAVYSQPFTLPPGILEGPRTTLSLENSVKQSVLKFLGAFYLEEHFTLPELSANVDLAKYCKENVLSDVCTTEHEVVEELLRTVKKLPEMGVVIPALGAGKQRETKYELFSAKRHLYPLILEYIRKKEKSENAARLGVPEDWIIKFIKQKEAFHKIPTSSVLEAIEELVGDGLIYSFSTNSYKSIV